jgi:hypothetical protein
VTCLRFPGWHQQWCCMALTYCCWWKLQRNYVALLLASSSLQSLQPWRGFLCLLFVSSQTGNFSTAPEQVHGRFGGS